MEQQIYDDVLDERREAFDLFDRDGSGYITADEFKDVMNKLGKHPSEEELKQMIKEHDSDNDGKINFDEFCRMLEETDEAADKRIREIFDFFDKDGSGLISACELKELMDRLGEILDDDEIQAMIDEADKDGDGQINFEEFKALIPSQKC